MDKPTEDTYTTELIAVIKEFLGPIGFDAEFNRKSPSGKPDILIYYYGKSVAIIENKIPEKNLSDPKLNKQAIEYAEWYKDNRKVYYYGVHNLKYLKLFKYISDKEPQKKINHFILPSENEWRPISEFPFKIMPWVTSINDFKQISTVRDARKNLESFFLIFKEALEGKIIDLSKDVIESIRLYIEQGASYSTSQMENLYKTNKHNVRNIYEEWRNKRGITKPRTDDELRKLLTLMIKEQLYTFVMKILFYYVLQSTNAELANQLNENLGKIEISDKSLFKKLFNVLFEFAIKKTNDFEEVFGSNTVEKLPFTSMMLPSLKELISYISQIRWSDTNVDIIGRIFETLIYTERRHLLGQHYTDTKIVDIILAATLREPDLILDPSCGSGTFLVRALNYWKINYTSNSELLDFIEGVDIEKLAVMLTKINLYIQTLGIVKNISDYIPNVHNNDIFKLNLSSTYKYIATNPPYTRQEEMTMAYYDKDYKKYFEETIEDIPDWSKRASIYAYFLVKAGKLLKEGGRLGFIVENSWTNAEYGIGLKKWFMNNFVIELIIESSVERWFEDAKVITNIIIAEKLKKEDNNTIFVYLKKPLLELIEDTPSSNDFTANQRYYESIENLLNKARAKKLAKNKDYNIFENAELKVIIIKKKLLEKVEEKFGRWGIFRGPKKYLEIIFQLLEKDIESIKFLANIIKINRGLTTNANDIFYLPSKYWEYSMENDKMLVLKDEKMKIIKLSKNYLKPLIRMSDIQGRNYEISTITKIKKEDYVLWVEDISQVQDNGTQEYLNWAQEFITEANKIEESFPSILKKIKKKPSQWTKLPDRSNAEFLFNNAVHKNFSINKNNVHNGQVDKRLFLGVPKVEINDKIIFASLNSILTYLGMELIGRTNLGEGALDVNVIDYQKIPMINPSWLEKCLKQSGELQQFLNLVDKILKMKSLNIEDEMKNASRIKMDEMILKPLGLNKKDVKNLYTELINLVNLREERATSIKKLKKGAKRK